MRAVRQKKKKEKYEFTAIRVNNEADKRIEQRENKSKR